MCTSAGQSEVGHVRRGGFGLRIPAHHHPRSCVGVHDFGPRRVMSLDSFTVEVRTASLAKLPFGCEAFAVGHIATEIRGELARPVADSDRVTGLTNRLMLAPIHSDAMTASKR